MAIFDFRRSPQPHPRFGQLQRGGGRWRGTIELERDRRVTLFLPGTRSGPLANGVQLAERASEMWMVARPEVWAHVTLSSVEIKRQFLGRVQCLIIRRFIVLAAAGAARDNTSSPAAPG